MYSTMLVTGYTKVSLLQKQKFYIEQSNCVILCHKHCTVHLTEPLKSLEQILSFWSKVPFGKASLGFMPIVTAADDSLECFSLLFRENKA